MALSAQQEKGNLYPSEKPSSFNKGQTGKGATIYGKVSAMKGSKFSQGPDKQAQSLRKVWNKAKSAVSRFGNF